MGGSKMIPIEQAVQGMILSCNITDRHDNILLPGNAILTPAMIASIRRHDIAEISVAVDFEDDQSVPGLDQKLKLEEKLQRVNQLFMLHENESANLQFKQYLINFIRKAKQ